jgi:hypothetical protein
MPHGRAVHTITIVFPVAQDMLLPSTVALTAALQHGKG